MQKILCLLMLSTLLSSCYTENKAIRQTWKAQAFHPKIVAKLCNEIYSNVDSNYTSEFLIKGDTLVLSDTVSYTDTIEKVNYKYIYQTTHSTDTFWRTRYVKFQDKSLQIVLQAQLNSVNNELIKQTQLMKMWRVVAIASALLIAVWIAIRIWI